MAIESAKRRATDAAPAADETAAVTLVLAGVPQLRLGAAVLATGTRKALALAVMAALEPALRRGRAADLLWPEADPAAARRNVRRDLFRLRQAGLPVRDEAGEALRLAPFAIDWPRPAALAPLWLDGLDEVAGAEFAHWVEATRDRLQRQWLEALEAEARALESGGRPDAAAQAWRALLADGAAGPGHAEARAALQRLAPERSELAEPEAPTQAPAAAPGGPLRVPFHGREAELAFVTEALQLGHVVLVDGGPGAGKTRLSLEALAPRGAALVVRCRPEDSAAPYASALRGLQAARDAAPGAALPAWVRRDLAALVPDWRGRAASDAAELPEPPRLQRAYRAALQALAADTFDGLVIDDWQWADEASRELWDLQAGKPGGPALPCTVVHRSGELTPAALQQRRRWIDAGLAQSLTLRPLGPAQAHGLLAALLPVLQLPKDPGRAWLDDIVARCAGNPLFLIETLRHAMPGSAEVPGGVQAIIVARARALGPAVRRVLEAASLAGDELAPRLLAAVVGIDELAVAQALEHAAAAELLVADVHGRHRFAHDLYAQAIAESLSAVRSAALHGQFARALAQGAAEPGRVALHHDLAGHPAEAAPWHLGAARVALQRQAWAQAEASATTAWAASADPALRVDARLVVVQARLRRSDTAGAQAALDEALRDAVRAGPARVAEVCLARAEVLTMTNRGVQALEDLQALENDPALGDELRRRLLQQRAAALGYMGRHDEAMPQLQRLLDTLPPSAMVEQMQVLNLLARNAYWAGQLDVARRHVERSLALARSLGDDVGLARNLHRLGALTRERGEIEEADALLRESADAARRAGHTEILRSALTTMATTRLDQLRLDEAELLLAECEHAAPFWETPDLEDVYDERRFRLHLLRGEVDAAWRKIERSIARHRDGGHLHSQLGALILALRLSLATGEVARARRLMDEALALHAAAGADSLHGQEVDAMVVPLLQAEGRAEEACRHAEAWLAAPQTRRVEEHARLLAAAAEAALDLGQAERAAAWLAQAGRLPVVAYELEALLLKARLRLARSAGADPAPARAAVRAWLARGALPALERRQLEQALEEYR